MLRAGAPDGEPALLFTEVCSGKLLKASRDSRIREPRLLLAEDGVFGSLGHAELHHALGWDLDRFAGLRIAAHASLAICQDKFSDAWHDEDILRFPIGQSGKVVQSLDARLLGEPSLLGHVIGNLRLGH